MTRRPASSHFAAVAAVLLAVLWASATVVAPAALAHDAVPRNGQAAAPDTASRSGTDTAVGVLAAVGAIGIGGGLVVVARRKRS